MTTGPAVARTVWTNADFDTMSWHDNAVHAVALEPAPDHPGRLLLDIDYILEWVPAEAPATTLSFWICPATLVFDRAWDLTSDGLNAPGFTQYLRHPPIYSPGYWLSADERGGFSFDQLGYTP